MTPKVDTFEQDIATEIKRKEASATQIAAASNNVGNNEPTVAPKKSSRAFFILLAILATTSIVGIFGVAYFYFTDSLLPPSQGSVAIKQSDIPKAEAALSSISPTLATGIGRYVTKVEKQQSGYIITINSYSSVFAYMIKNEDMYIEELASIISPPLLSATTSIVKPKEVVATTTKSASTTPVITQGTTTQKVATSTKKVTLVTKAEIAVSTTTKEVTPKVETTVNMPYYKDVTVSNQNMRVWTYGDRTVVYAFITTDKIAISQTTEGILSLKSAIIR